MKVKEEDRGREDRTDHSALASGAIIGDGDRKRAPFLVLSQFFSIFFFEIEVLCSH